MADFFDDPDFPDRPQHPDFHRLMGVVAYLDGEATEGGRDSLQVAGEVVDVDSLVYMALQRARRAAALTGLPEQVLAAVYLDGFVAGARFESEGGHRD
jgi:hypothetical protein